MCKKTGYKLQDIVSEVRNDSTSNRRFVLGRIDGNQIELRNLLHKQQKDMETRDDNIHLKLNALFALGATVGVIWIYCKYKTEKRPMLDCNSLDKPAKDEQKQADPPMYPNLRQPNTISQLVSIAAEKREALNRCQEFLHQAQEIELVKEPILAYVNEMTSKKVHGSYTPYGL
jgi:hypothetical protein